MNNIVLQDLLNICKRIRIVPDNSVVRVTKNSKIIYVDKGEYVCMFNIANMVANKLPYTKAGSCHQEYVNFFFLKYFFLILPLQINQNSKQNLRLYFLFYALQFI